MVVIEVRAAVLTSIVAYSLEKVFTGAAPFADILPASAVIQVLSGKRPGRPKNQIMTDRLWKLTQRCLERNPGRRPDIADIVRYLSSSLAVRQDRACVTNARLDDPSRGTQDGAYTTQSKESWGGLLREGSRFSPMRRTFLQRAYNLLLTCGKPSAHEYQDGLQILLEKGPHLLKDRYEGQDLYRGRFITA
jgi:hypothetical protein